VLYRTRYAETARPTAEATEAISDLQFTERYRVPFQFSRLVREHLPTGAFLQSSAGVTVTDLDGNVFYDLTGSYGVNPVTAHETYTLRDMSEATLGMLRRRNNIACVLVNPLQALHPNASAPGDSGLIDSSRRAHCDRRAYAAWLERVREVCTERRIVCSNRLHAHPVLCRSCHSFV
jgi:hypothetical protein